MTATLLFAAATSGCVTPACCAQRPELPESIGTATLASDGTITLTLYATGAGGDRGEGVLTYPPSHPNYAEVKAHIGPLTPGEVVLVKPWPDDDRPARP